MPLPKQRELGIPLLRALKDAGGAAQPRDLYPKLGANFSLTVEEQEERLGSSPTTRKWWNLVQWVRQHLVEAGEIGGSTRGVWKITPKGLACLEERPPRQSPNATVAETTLRDLVEQNREQVRSRLKREISQLTPAGFERFCRVLLQALGFDSVEVTRASADGGIDGFGDFRQGAVRIRSAFQAKRWAADRTVGRPEIDRFRGAIQGEFDHGVFLTTSRFSREAKDTSIKRGAITILLLDGDAIADAMTQHGLGVRTEPVHLYDLDDEFFDFEE